MFAVILGPVSAKPSAKKSYAAGLPATAAAPEQKDVGTLLAMLTALGVASLGGAFVLQGLNGIAAERAKERLAARRDELTADRAELAARIADIDEKLTLADQADDMIDEVAAENDNEKSARAPRLAKDMLGAQAVGYPDADDAAEPYVGDVTVSAPQLRRYRGTLTRNVCQTAVVEFTAFEGNNVGALAEEIAEKIPAASWATRDGGSYFYFDKVDDIGPGTVPSVAGGVLKSIAAPEEKGDLVDFRTGETIEGDEAEPDYAYADSTHVESWASLRLITDDGGSVTTDTAYADFAVWCSREDIDPMPQTSFDAAMSALGYVRQRIAGATRYIGVMIS